MVYQFSCLVRDEEVFLTIEYYLNLWCTTHSLLSLVVFSERGEERGGEEKRKRKRRRGEEGRTLLKFRDFVQSEREFMKDFA